MDLLILEQLRNKPMDGKDIVELIYRKFHVPVSLGIVYSTLYSLEKNGLIKGMLEQNKRIYTLTLKGKETIKTILNSREKILGLMLNLFL